MNDNTTAHEQGRRDGVLWCAAQLKQIALVSQDGYAEAFRGIAEAWEKGAKPVQLQQPCANLDFGDG